MKKIKTVIVVPTVLAFLILFAGIGFPETSGAVSHESHHPSTTQQQDQSLEATNTGCGMESPMMTGGMMGGGMMQGMMGPGNEKGMPACGSAGSGERMPQHQARCENPQAHSC